MARRDETSFFGWRDLGQTLRLSERCDSTDPYLTNRFRNLWPFGAPRHRLSCGLCRVCA